MFPYAGSASVIRKDGSKSARLDWDIQNGTMPIHEIHPASYDPKARMALMDDMGVWAHVIYPNVTGFGTHKLMAVDRDLGFLIEPHVPGGHRDRSTQ